MKKLKLLIVSLLFIGITPAYAGAQVLDPVCQDNPEAALCQDNEATKNQDQKNNEITGSDGIISRVADLLLVLSGVIAVVMIVVGGIMFALSAGDAQRVKRAKDLIIYAIVGMMVAVFARQIILFVLSRL